MGKIINFKRFFVAVMIPCFVLTGTIGGFAQTKVTLPNMIAWSAYDVGSAGYVQAAAVGNALHKKYGTKLRVIPGGTDIGRLAPLKAGKVDFSLTGIGAWLAWRGIYDFASLEWGPQPFRAIWQSAGEVGFVTAANANIKTIADLRGKRVGYTPANPTYTLVQKGLLAFGGLTESDIKKVMFPGVGKANKGLVEDQVDAIFANLTGPVMYELASSPRGIHWLEIPAADKEGWERFTKIIPVFGPAKVIKAAGIDPVKDKPKEMLNFAYPSLISYQNTDEELAYNLAKAIHESYEIYKDATVGMICWALNSAVNVPQFAPFHKGTIRFFKEMGVWTPKLEERNDKMLSEEKERMEKWKRFKEEVVRKNLSAAEIAKDWDKLEGAIPIE